MRIVSRVLAVIGFLVLVVGGVMLAKNAIDINQLHAVANANRSTPFYSPLNDVLITASLAAGGGLLLGLGLGLWRPATKKGDETRPPATAPTKPPTTTPTKPSAT